MYNIILSLLFTVWIFRIGANLLTYLQLWFVKEYRWDRMLVHLKTSQGKYIFWPQWRLPPKNFKSFILLLGELGVLGGVGVWLSGPVWWRLLVVDLLSFPVSAFLVWILYLPTAAYHRYMIAKAARLLRQHRPLLVIGVTGSYGKTSTKEHIATILSTKYKVLKTAASKNSLIGIAEQILAKLTSETEAFVVEMGAYKKGEIAQMAAWVKPHIGVVTAINEQHQDLFGSLENTMEAKYELIENLVGPKIAIFNADDPRVLAMSQWALKAKLDTRYYSLEPNQVIGKHPTLTVSKLEVKGDGIRFNLKSSSEQVSISLPLLGRFQATNFAAAASVALVSGMSLGEIAQAARLIKPVPKVMQPLKGPNGSLLINDTFNNNPDAAIAALEYLSTAKGRKFLVFQPMIELGKYSETAHIKVGQKAGQVCDCIILTNSDFSDSLIAGVKSVNPQKPVYVMKSREAAKYLRKRLGKDDVLLFKGKSSELVLKEICYG